MKLIKYVPIKGKIVCKTGLRIGGSKESIEIGGMDNPIIRHPVTGHPYIPGSSLKGKIRCLLEQKYSQHSQRTGNPCDCGKCDICRLFGTHAQKEGKEPTRLIFRDAPMTEDSLMELQDKGLDFSEVKTEVIIDRKTGSAKDKGLRTQERVPEGTKFNFSVSFKVFDKDEKDFAKLKELILEGFKMLLDDYLGGSGSRGYGKISFEGLTFDGEPL